MASTALDYEELSASLRAIITPHSVFELRLLGMRRKRTDGGYFDNVEAAASALSGLSEPYKGIYLTPNPVMPELIARAKNRIKPWVEWTTDDQSITRRKWLLIDVDPERPSGISSTNLEHNRALAKAKAIMGMLEVEYGWCDGMLNDSGNGAHLLYPIDLPNTDEVKTLIRDFLKSLAHRYNEPGCKIDTGMYNASRIWRLPGTFARKGDNTTERPHRKAKVLQLASDVDLVTFKQLQEFIYDNPVQNSSDREPKGRTGGTTNSGEQRNTERLYYAINKQAMHRLGEWVPAYFPGCRPYKGGFRVSSAELGRNREEDLTIHPWPIGIKDFGEHDMGDEKEGRRSPVSAIAEFHFDGDMKQAAEALAATLKVPISEFDDLPEEGEEGLNESKGYDEVFDAKAAFDFKAIKSYSQLEKRHFAELKWIIPNVLPVGCFILAARPKMRKTWLALQLCTAVATGGKLLEWTVNKGKALMLALEDNERRIKSRVETLYMFDMDIPDLKDFMYFTEGHFPRGEDGVAIIRKYLDDNPDTTLVVIDTFAHFRALSKERDIYLKDYIAVMPLTKLAAERQVCILIVHHEKKGLADTKSGDFLEDVSGSAGITGGVDGVMSIKGRRGIQEENESRKLLITGRDIPGDYEIDISFDAERGGWLPAARQDVKTAIRQLFLRASYIMQSQIFVMLPNVPQGRIRRSLTEMQFDGEIEQTRYGYKMVQK